MKKKYHEVTTASNKDPTNCKRLFAKDIYISVNKIFHWCTPNRRADFKKR